MLRGVSQPRRPGRRERRPGQSTPVDGGGQLAERTAVAANLLRSGGAPSDEAARRHAAWPGAGPDGRDMRARAAHAPRRRLLGCDLRPWARWSFIGQMVHTASDPSPPQGQTAGGLGASGTPLLIPLASGLVRGRHEVAADVSQPGASCAAAGASHPDTRRTMGLVVVVHNHKPVDSPHDAGRDQASSPVVGSITAFTTVTLSAGNPPQRACSLTVSALSAT